MNALVLIFACWYSLVSAASPEIRWGVIDGEPIAEESKRFSVFHQFLTGTKSPDFLLRNFKSLELAEAALNLGEVQLVILRPSEYLELRKKPGFKAVASFLFKGLPFHHSLFLARAKTRALSLTDFKGRRLGLGKKRSLSSYRVPLLELRKKNINLNSFFSKVITDLNHAQLELAVVKGELDLAATSDIVHESLIAKNKIQASDTKIVQQSEPIPNEVIVTTEKFWESAPGKIMKNKFSEVMASGSHLPLGILPEPWNGITEVQNTVMDRFEFQLKAQ